MLKKIDNNRILSINSAREQYPKSKILFLITDMSDMSDIFIVKYYILKRKRTVITLIQVRYTHI